MAEELRRRRGAVLHAQHLRRPGPDRRLPGDAPRPRGGPWRRSAKRELLDRLVRRAVPGGWHGERPQRRIKTPPRDTGAPRPGDRTHAGGVRAPILAWRIPAAGVGLTTFQLIGLFKRTASGSDAARVPHASVRLGMACRHLRHAPALAEVATAVGFTTAAALNKHFKRCYGITPPQPREGGRRRRREAIFANTLTSARLTSRNAPLLPRPSRDH